MLTQFVPSFCFRREPLREIAGGGQQRAPGCRAAGFVSLTAPWSFTQLLTPGSQHLVRAGVRAPRCGLPRAQGRCRCPSWPVLPPQPDLSPRLQVAYTEPPAFCLPEPVSTPRAVSAAALYLACLGACTPTLAHGPHTCLPRTARTSRPVELLLLVFASASPPRRPSKKMSGSLLCTLPVGFFSLAFNSLTGIESHPYSCFV